ncbi:MAG TPA: tRNA pseudouridine(38-40) synthase TruA [Vicinamibacteria bacterium]
MPLYRVTLAYDGTDFLGWQLQPRGGRTVQGAVEEALSRLAAGARVAVSAAGRTDAGVHALGQVASFDLPRAIAPEELRRALNGLLPGDVRVLDAAPAPPGFHARKSAASKLYRYELDCGGIQLPQRRRFAGFVPRPLDEGAVRATAALYLGRHDFASLASAGSSAKTTVRTVLRSEATFSGTTLAYEAEADGFLRRMVRSMVGGLVAAGRGAVAVEALARALEARDRRTWPAPAPPCGLTLVRVLYPPAMLG